MVQSSAAVVTPGGVIPPVPRRRRAVGRPLSLIVAAVFIGLLVCAAWLVHLGLEAGKQLAAVRTDVAQLRSSAETPGEVGVPALEADLRRRTTAVRRETRNPLWRIAAHLPDFGSDFRVASGMAGITDGLAQNVLPPLVDSSHGLSLTTLRRPDGSIDVASLEQIKTATASALPAIDLAQRQLSRLDGRVHLNALAKARAQFAVQLTGIKTTLTTADQALTLLPPMLGADRPHDYFVVFQNLAEARGTGGLMGTWGILHAASGKLTLSRTGADDELEKAASLKPAAVEPGGGFDDTWGLLNPLTDYAVANLSPSFAPAGQLFLQHADSQLGMHFDGVIALNPRTLGTLLGSRRVTLSDGTVVTGSTVLQVTESDLYTRYGENSPVRKQLLAQLARDAFDTLETASPHDVLKGLQRSIGVGDLQLYSADPGEESVLAATDLGGVLPATAGSFAHLVVNNAGPKTDLYLHRAVTYSTAGCPARGAADQTRASEIQVTLTDEVPPGQAAVISHDEDDPAAPYGRGHDYVSVYGPVGGEFTSATLNGSPVDVATSVEAGHLVMSVDLLEPEGAPQVLAFQLAEPASSQLITWRPQPMGQAEKDVDHYSPC